MRLAAVRRELLIICLGLLLATCANGPKATLTGQVRDAYTNKPLEGAQVMIGKQPGIATDAEGRWATQDWSLSDKAVLQATGYESATFSLSVRPELEKPQALTPTLDAALRPNTLTGTIRDAFSGQPIAGAVVKAADTITATTDSNGRYELNEVPEAYQIVVTAPEHEAAQRDVRRSTEQDISLRPTTLSGQVIDIYSSKPLAGVKVVLDDLSVITDAEGRFTLKHIPPDGQIVFSHDGYDEISMPLDRTTTVDVAMRPNVLEGVVRDAHNGALIVGATVIASQTVTGTAIANVRTDQAGHYHLEHMPEGVYLKVLYPGYRPAEVQVPAGSLQDDIKLEPLSARAPYLDVTTAISRRRMGI
ncbi:MAG TPA: carboxypeptidase regulatory-like domain-containing protein [Herpetosiphonaceae bacterium]|nr:carboxypeptidase regulatory-like domain-containing protein [Herpetosiphonaceae bacterium]